MIKYTFTIVLLFIGSQVAMGQGYDLEVVISNVDCGDDDTTFSGTMSIGGSSVAFNGTTSITRDFSFTSAPGALTIDIEALDDIIPGLCTFDQTIRPRISYAGSSGCQTQTITVGNPSVTIEATWTPNTWAINEPDRNPGGVYCSDDNVQLNASLNYGTYVWEYRINGTPTWNRITGASRSTLDRNARDIFGTNISSIYGRPVTFSARFGGCSREISNSYTFYPASPTNFDTPSTPQSSICERDAGVTISNLSYPDGSAYAGEELEIEIAPNDNTLPTYTFVVSGESEYTFDANSTPVVPPDEPMLTPEFSISGNPWTIIITNSLTASSGEGDAFVNSCSSFPGRTFEFDPPLAFDFQDNYPRMIESISCNSGNDSGSSADGEIQVRVSNGSADYRYEIFRNGSEITGMETTISSTTHTFTGLAEGSYYVRVTDSCGSIISSNTSLISLTEPSVITITGTPVAETCNGTPNNASINPTVSGGVSPYTYQWSGGSSATTRSISNISGSASGTSYTLRVTDVNGCRMTRTFTVREPSAISISGTVTNETCPGTPNNGRIAVDVSGGRGTGTYNYQWSGGSSATTEDLSNISGTVSGRDYTLTVTDRNDNTCSVSRTFTVTEPSAIVISGSATAATCIDRHDGSIDITSVTGGTSPYNYSWSNGETTQDISALQGSDVSSGISYILTVTDAGLCQTSRTFYVTSPSQISVTAVVTDESCFGDPNDGSIDITSVTGGTRRMSEPFYDYSWSSGQTTADINDLAGSPSGTTYTLTITDTLGCTNNFAFNIVEPTELTAPAATISHYRGYEISCNAGSDGTIEIDPSGGTPNMDGTYNYQWSDGSNATTRDLSGVGAGTYNVTISDANGCTFDINGIVLTEPTPLAGSSDVPTYNDYEISCQGGSNGEIDVTVSGGVLPYSYQWSGSSTATSEDLSGQLVGSYALEITDANGCEITLPTILLEAPDALTATTSTVGVTCFGGNDGSITVTPSGGVVDYEYSIDGGDNYQPENIFEGLSTDIYTITIRDNNDCVTTSAGTVSTPNPIAGSIGEAHFVSCYSDSDGELTASSISGGTGILSYLWSTGETTVNATNLPAGNYNVLVTDANGCSQLFSYIPALIEPDELLISSETISQVSCYGGNDGAIDIIFEGGTPAFGYSWDNGATTEDISGLMAGDYTVIITDGHNCTTTQTYTINEPPLLSVSVDDLTHVSCFLGNDGSATLLATGGTMTYEYSVDGVGWESSPVIGGLTEGSYTFYVRDTNGCISTVGDTITEPTLLEVSTQNIINTTCGFPVGSAESLVTGGTSPYTFSWTDVFSNEISINEHITNMLSGIYTVEVTDANSCTQSAIAVISNTDGADYTITNIEPALCHDSADGQATVVINSVVMPYEVLWSSGETTETAVGLVAGINVVTVTDGNDCDAIQTVMVGAPVALGVSTAFEQYPSCNGVMDAVTEIVGTGGTAPYSYTWSNGQTGNTISAVGAGDYVLTIVDAHACEEVFTITVQETPILEVSVVQSTNPTCTSGADGILEVMGEGGTAPYTYNWGALGTSSRVESLPSGNYPVTIFDVNGCIASASLEITDPELLNYILIRESSPTCNGVTDGFVEIAGINGTAPYIYQWDTGDAGSRLQNIAGGSYEVIITDFNGCTNTLTVLLEEPEVLTVGVTNQLDPSCYGFDNGSIEVLATGGTAPYFYNWSTGVTDASLSNVTIGTYVVNVSDANGCRTSLSVTLSEPEPLTLTVIDFVLPTCYNTDDGAIEISIVGGTAPYATSWTTGSSNNRITSLIQGAYEVTIVDSQGCVLTQTIDLTGVEEVQADVTTIDPFCYGYADGMINLTTTGGTGTLSYLWNDGSTELNRSSLASGDYSITITDENGCTKELNFTLTDPDEIIVDLPDAEICIGGNHRAIIDLGIGYTYTWTLANGFTTSGSEVNLGQTGIYTVVATDANGCFGEGTFSISTNEDLLQADFLMTTQSFVGDTVVIIDISWPLPENVLWGFDEDVATILSSSNDYLELVFTKEGTHQITEDVTLAECADYLAQDITILAASEKSGDQGGRSSGEDESLIASLKVYPNPTDGQFNVEVELSRTAAINLKLINATNNRQVLSDEKSGNDHYTLDYSLSNRLQPGIYFIVVTAEGELETIRLMVR